MIYQDPLAYVLGLEGVALLRGFSGEFDRAFTEARIAEMRRLLDDDALAGSDVTVERVDTVSGYRAWSDTYDEPRNGLFDFEEPIVREVLDGLPPATALDAACGTGRYAEYLAAAGHRVIGVDGSPEMLDLARGRVPGAEFRLGDLHGLPVPDDTVDVLVCALALAHLPGLEQAMAEFARVLRPGGHLVVSDLHHDSVRRGSIPPVRGADGRPGRVVTHGHRTGDYLRAALPLGFRVQRCEEPRLPVSAGSREPATDPGPWELWPWSLTALVPEAAAAASAGSPATVVWHFTLSRP